MGDFAGAVRIRSASPPMKLQLSRIVPVVPLLLAVALLSIKARASEPGDVSPAAPVIPDHTFNLSDFKAVADGKTLNTDAFKQAVAAVDKAGGGTLNVPAGVFLTGPFDLCNGINLHLDAKAKILFSSKAEDYRFDSAERNRRLQPQLSAVNHHDIMISGAGTLDGQGGVWWPAARAMRDPVTGRQFNGTTPRPPLLVFARCQRVRVEGITIQNSPALNFGINGCQDATADGVTILNPPDSPNTDGINPKGAQRVLISRCHIDTGDDCIAAGGGKDTGVERDILITDCTFLHGHGCSIGSGTMGGVSNFTVRRCTFDGTDTGIRLKSARDRGGLVENLTYSDLTMKNVGHAISLNSHYEGTTTDTAKVSNEPSQPVTPTTPQWRHLIIRNLSATNCTVDAGLIVGLPEMPAEDIVFDHVNIDAPKGLQIGYAKNISLHDTHIVAKEGPPLILSDTVQGLTQTQTQ
jgi:polygalacturonase